MLMTVYKPVTLRMLYQSNMALSANLAICPTPSVSEVFHRRPQVPAVILKEAQGWFLDNQIKEFPSE